MKQLSGWDKDTSPFHRGEQILQERLGIREYQESMGRQIMRPFVPEQHREFFHNLPFFIAGSVDQNGAPWASILFGNTGFVSTPTDRALTIAASSIQGDPFFENAKTDAPVSFVGIEMHTRRRNRINGIVRKQDGEGVHVDVVQSFGNCPQYIQTRAMQFVRDPAASITLETQQLAGLDDEAVRMIRAADTFFVASHNNIDDKRDTGGVDVNHRGGQPGFVKIDGNVLTIPDYKGNFAFNTLGNLQVNPKAGLLFIDFENGDILQLTGTTELIWDKTEELEAFRGAERAWKFTVDHGVRLKNASPIRWTFGEYSPNTLLTGDWAQAESLLKLEQKREQWRAYHVAHIVDDSPTIRSFYLQPADDEALFDYQAGQFLPLRITPNEASDPVIRTYTLSSSPNDKMYRISVKREGGNGAADGLVSSYLHDNLKPGDVIEAQAPRGNFTLDTQTSRPAVLIAAGVGITPMISMLRTAITESIRSRSMRPIIVVHVTRTTADRAFKSEFDVIASSSNGLVRYVSVVSQPELTQSVGHDFDFAGRLTPAILQSVLALADYQFFLCGPSGFIQSSYDMVREMGVDDANIFSESFGSSSVRRRLADDVNNSPAEALEEAQSGVVTFANSKFEQAWAREDGSLLDFAENHGLAPNFGCRNGSCGSCAVTLTSGKVAYRTDPSFKPDAGEILLCCATPAQDDANIEIAL